MTMRREWKTDRWRRHSPESSWIRVVPWGNCRAAAPPRGAVRPCGRTATRLATHRAERWRLL